MSDGDRDPFTFIQQLLNRATTVPLQERAENVARAKTACSRIRTSFSCNTFWLPLLTLLTSSLTAHARVSQRSLQDPFQITLKTALLKRRNILDPGPPCRPL